MALTTLRKTGTQRDGRNFPHSVIVAVWTKALIVPDHNATLLRKDCCGALIRFSDYGNTESAFGWEIDHIFPVAKGGEDNFANLQPLQWKNNRGKSDNWPEWVCSVRYGI